MYKFESVSCSQCGQDFGPGNHGFSHCENHAGKSIKPVPPALEEQAQAVGHELDSESIEQGEPA